MADVAQVCVLQLRHCSCALPLCVRHFRLVIPRTLNIAPHCVAEDKQGALKAYSAASALHPAHASLLLKIAYLTKACAAPAKECGDFDRPTLTESVISTIASQNGATSKPTLTESAISNIASQNCAMTKPLAKGNNTTECSTTLRAEIGSADSGDHYDDDDDVVISSRRHKLFAAAMLPQLPPVQATSPRDDSEDDVSVRSLGQAMAAMMTAEARNAPPPRKVDAVTVQTKPNDEVGAKVAGTQGKNTGSLPPGTTLVDGYTCYVNGLAMLSGGFGLPRKLFERLYSYQRAGIAWMWSLHADANVGSKKPSGGILADDMGLGEMVEKDCRFVLVVTRHALQKCHLTASHICDFALR